MNIEKEIFMWFHMGMSTSWPRVTGFGCYLPFLVKVHVSIFIKLL